jgi:PTS system mannose-specific IIA component
MIGIVVAAHGPLPAALLASSTMILGEVPQIATVSLMPGDSLEELVERLRSAAAGVDTGEGVLLLLDMFGGTPANAALLLTQQGLELLTITGVNLPMLLEILLARQQGQVASLEALGEQAIAAGQGGVLNLTRAFQRFRQG